MAVSLLVVVFRWSPGGRMVSRPADGLLAGDLYVAGNRRSGVAV